VYGHPDLLKSPEYQTIKASAMEECQLSHKIRQKSVEQSADAKLRKGMKTSLLRTFLFNDLCSRGKVGPVKPLTEEAISLAMTEKLGEGWSQSSVSREFEKLYPGLGIARYVEICGIGKTERNGILNKSADGTTDVDAFSYDEDPIDD
jgi:hypothetical protein